MLKENLDRIECEMHTICEKAGRKREEVLLIAVSKTKPVSMLQEIYREGVRDFGENKVQEIIDKYDHMPSDVRWHMIGHLQRNKIKYIIDKVSLIHSVDSLKLAQAIEKEASKKGVHIDILMEVNIADEESKFGLRPEETEAVILEVAKFPHVHVKGLMTIAPFVENPEENRIYFANLHKLSVDIAQKNIDNVTMSILSMGMTNDYQVAIDEGSNMIRVGTGIFGERNYNE